MELALDYTISIKTEEALSCCDISFLPQEEEGGHGQEVLLAAFYLRIPRPHKFQLYFLFKIYHLKKLNVVLMTTLMSLWTRLIPMLMLWNTS